MKEATHCGDQKDTKDLAFLDGLRGLAALEVLLGHARWLLWEGYREGYLLHPDSYSWIGKIGVHISFLFRFGHESVMFFFVLSGFVIHLKYARNLRQEGVRARFSWITFVKRRAIRLYPPLLLAMLLTLVLDKMGNEFGFPIYHQTTPYPLINDNYPPPRHDIWTALGNMTFLMTAVVSCWGTNHPLWSLHYEWWFYMIYPLFWWLSRRSIKQATGVMVILFAASLLPSYWPVRPLAKIFAGMIAWWLGVLLADTYSRRIKLSLASWKWFGLLLPMLPFFQGHGNDTLRDMLWAAGFSGLIAWLLDRTNGGRGTWGLARLRWLGDMSYSLYVLHMPLLVFLSGWLMSSSPGHYLPASFNCFFLGVGLALALAYAAHWMVEKPFMGFNRKRVAAA